MPAANSELVSNVTPELSDVFDKFMLGQPGTPVKEKTLEKERTQAEKTAIKRTGYLEWEEYFMMAALVASQRSKDPSCQVGVVIVNKHKKIVGTGYNGCSDDEYPWGKGNEDPLNNKYPYVVHAEANAILNKIGDNLEGTTLYTTTFPCNECAKLIIQSRISSVVYLNDRSDPSYMASKRMFNSVGITYRQFTMNKDEITITLKRPEDEKFYYTLLLFTLAFLYKQAFAIPGSFFMNLLAGALFGSLVGIPLVCILTAIGASCCFLLSYLFAHSLVDRFFHNRLHTVRAKVAEEKDRLFFFLLSARVFPFTPHWLLNITSPFVGIPLPLHFATVGIGLVPYNFLCVRAGCILSEIRSAGDVFDVFTLLELFFTAGVLLALSRISKRRQKA